MKKFLFLIVVAVLSTSCYNTRTYVGDVQPDNPIVSVNSVTNHHFLFGLIPASKTSIKASDYVGNAKGYVVRNNQTFLNGFLGTLTCGIYTPSTTTFYVPVEYIKK